MLPLLFAPLPSRRRVVRALTLVLVVPMLAVVVAPGRAVAAAPTDHPWSAVWSPRAGSMLTVGTPVVVEGGAINGEAGGIVSVEFSVDGGETWLPTDNREGWTGTFTPTQPGPLTIASRAATADVVETPMSSRTVIVRDPDGSCPCVLSLPDIPDYHGRDMDDRPVETGLRFRVDRPGLVTGMFFAWYGGGGEPLVGHLWSGDGQRLAETAITVGTDNFPHVAFEPPVPVEPGQTYVVSYYTAVGHYTSTENYFTEPVVQSPFETVVDEAGGSGVYVYEAGGGFPTETWNASNYWVAPEFVTV